MNENKQNKWKLVIPLNIAILWISNIWLFSSTFIGVILIGVITGNIGVSGSVFLGFKKVFLEHSLGVWKDGKVKSAYEPSGPSVQSVSWCL